VLDALMSAAPCADRVFVQATCILAFCDHAQIANKGQANQPSLFQQPARVSWRAASHSIFYLQQSPEGV
jgi:hypothetical protein